VYDNLGDHICERQEPRQLTEEHECFCTDICCPSLPAVNSDLSPDFNLSLMLKEALGGQFPDDDNTMHDFAHNQNPIILMPLTSLLADG
jgi:hypothetical protein